MAPPLVDGLLFHNIRVVGNSLLERGGEKRDMGLVFLYTVQSAPGLHIFAHVNLGFCQLVGPGVSETSHTDTIQ